MPFHPQHRSRRLLALAGLALSVLAGACAENGDETAGNVSAEPTATEPAATDAAPLDPATAQYVANLKLQLSLQNDTATPESVREYIADGADPGSVDERMNLLIHAVNIKQDFKISDINIDPDDTSETFFSIVDVQGNATYGPPKDPENIARICEVLIEEGAEVNFVGYGLQTPLKFALRFCGTPSVQVLLDAGADPNLAPPRSNGKPTKSPLNIAVTNECPDSIMLLLEAGAQFDPNEIADRNGKKLGTLLEAANSSTILQGTPALAALQEAARSQASSP